MDKSIQELAQKILKQQKLLLNGNMKHDDAKELDNSFHLNSFLLAQTVLEKDTKKAKKYQAKGLVWMTRNEIKDVEQVRQEQKEKDAKIAENFPFICGEDSIGEDFGLQIAEEIRNQ